MEVSRFKIEGQEIQVKDTIARQNIGDLDNLETSAKNNLVEAINEANQHGGSSTTDYNDLENKPSINNVSLVGNVTSQQLGIDGTTNYNELSNKPSINGVPLSGNKTTSDLHIEGGGHTIQNDGVDMTDRYNLNFVDQDLSDDSVNDSTDVKPHLLTQEEWNEVISSLPDSTSLGSMGDVSIDSLTLSNGQILVYNSTTQKWENEDNTTGSSSLSGLSDVSIDSLSLSNGQILVYNSTTEEWENSSNTPSFDDVTNRPQASANINIGSLNLDTPTVGANLPVLFDETGGENKVGWYRRGSDGKVKPIYRKDYKITAPPNSSSANIANLPSDYEKAWIIDGFLYVSATSGTMPLNFYSSSNEMIATWIRNGSGDKSIAMQTNYSLYYSKDVYVSIQYTKTTDTWKDLP